MLDLNIPATATSAESSTKHRQSSASPDPKNAAADTIGALAQPVVPAWSPIVVAGVVRMIEFILIVAIGWTIYVAYLVPIEGFEWRYVGAVFGIAVLAMLAFQTADIYQVQAFRGYEKQYFRLASAWSVVFLIVISFTFFSKIGDHYSRLWLGSFYAAGLVVLLAFRRTVFLLVRQWTRQGRLDRRTVVVGADARGDALIRSLAAQRDSDVRVLGVFDDRGEERTLAQVGERQKLGTVDDLVRFARRTRIDLVIFALPISAESRILEMLKKLWVLPVDIRLAAPSKQAPLPPARLFLYRPGAGLRHHRQADHGLGRGHEMAVRQDRRQRHPSPRLSVHAAHGACDQARQQGARVFQTEALWFQQRGDRSLQIPLHACGSVRSHGGQAGAEGRSARDEGGRVHSQDLAR